MHCETPSALSHGDGAPGAGAEDSSPAHADFGGLSSGAAPVVVLLDVVPLPPRYSAPTVAGCRLGGYPAGRDRRGGKRAAGGMSEDHDRCWRIEHHERCLLRCCSSTLHIGWGFCDRLCLVLVCRGRYGGSSLHSGIEFGRSRTG